MISRCEEGEGRDRRVGGVMVSEDEWDISRWLVTSAKDGEFGPGVWWLCAVGGCGGWIDGCVMVSGDALGLLCWRWEEVGGDE